LSYPDPIKKKIGEARAEARKWFTEITRNVEQRKVRVKTDVIDSPFFCRRGNSELCGSRKGEPDCDWNKRKVRC
jgi:hypothetical protein